MDEIKFPASVLALAEKVKGNPIAFREYDDKIVIVFEDGRKIAFLKEDASPAVPHKTAKSKEK